MSKSIKKIFFLLVLSVSVCPALFSYTGEKIGGFVTPGKHPTGLTYDGKNLWLADRQTDKLYCLDAATGKTIRELESPGYWPMGLAWDGEALWNSDTQGISDLAENRGGMVHRIDPQSGAILKSVQTPLKNPVGLAWDGHYLWIADPDADRIMQCNPEDGSTILSFPAPATETTGLAWDGRYLWASDRINDEIYLIDPQSGAVIMIADAPGKYVMGLAAEGKNLWAVDYQDKRVYQLKIRDGEKYVCKDERIQQVTINLEMKNFGPGKVLSLDAHLAIPENRVNQEILSLEFNPGTGKEVADQWGQKTMLFHQENVPAGKKIYNEMKVTFKSWMVRYFIYPDTVGKLEDIPREIREQYLGDDMKYQLKNPEIVKTVQAIVGSETNPYWIVRKIHQFLIDKLTYIMDGVWDMAPTVLRNGHGSCSEYSFTFIALCRAAGIPCRYVGSTWNRKDDASMDDVYHRWAEVYLPNYEWVPVDTTHGDRPLPRDQALPVGYVSNMALITTQSGGGSKTLGWNYNFFYFLKTDPKTLVHINNFADWEPVESKK